MRLFPIQLDAEIKHIPWDMLEPHEPQAWKNHRQTLVQLAVRGGITPCEAVALMEDRPWERMGVGSSTLLLKQMVERWKGVNMPAVCQSPSRIERGIDLLQRLRDGHAVPHRGHYNELIAILEACK